MSKKRHKPKRPVKSATVKPPQTSGPGKPKNLRLMMVVLLVIAGGVTLGVLFLPGPNDAPSQKNGGDPSSPDSSQHDPSVPTSRGLTWQEIDNAKNDGWDTEVFASDAGKQLKLLGKLLTHVDDIDDAAVEELIADGFACQSLRPADLVTVLDDQHLKIDRLSTAAAEVSLREQTTSSVDLPLQGASGLAKALAAVGELFLNATDVRFKFKIFRVASRPDEISTRQYFAISGRTESGMVEQHATWDIGWARGAGGAPPRMRWLRVEEFEQAESRQPGGTLLSDCTESVLVGNRIYADQFLRGMNHWLQRIQDPSPFNLFGNPGLAIGDVNGDGLDDLYVCQEAGLPNRLFIQNADGTAEDQSASLGVDWLQSSRSALFVDLDNDSDQDLVVAIMGGVVVAENDGKGQFHLRAVLSSSVDTMSVSAVDYDLDGQLDIYVCSYYSNTDLEHGGTGSLPGAAAGFVVHDANNGGKNNLFRNEISADGSWRFSDVTAEVGLDQNNHRWSLAASWDDYDNDGDQDLYVANDYGRDHFYRNDLGAPSAAGKEQSATRQFVDISDIARVEDSASGMSITWGDYDRDGWMDVLVSNMWSSAGNRIAFQEQFRPETPPEVKRRFQRLARGNTLLRNLGDGTFADRSAPAGVEMGRWAWGSHFVDLNNDGWEDLLVSNGYITTEDTGDL
jgi:hypothetical protein